MSKECCMCFKKIDGKPWMSVKTLEEKPVSCCSYLCSQSIDRVVGKQYLNRIINKEDFNHITPITRRSNTNKYDSLITNTERQEILNEIILEEQRMNQLEEDYYNESYSSEENDEY